MTRLASLHERQARGPFLLRKIARFAVKRFCLSGWAIVVGQRPSEKAPVGAICLAVDACFMRASAPQRMMHLASRHSRNKTAMERNPAEATKPLKIQNKNALKNLIWKNLQI